MSDPLAKMQRLRKRQEHEKRKEENRRKQREQENGYSWSTTVPKSTSSKSSTRHVSFSSPMSNGSLEALRKHHEGDAPSSRTQLKASPNVPSTSSHRKRPIQAMLRPSPTAKRKLAMESFYTPIDEKWLDKPATKRKKEHELPKPAAARNPKQTPPPKVAKKTAYDDSSSDEDIDLLAHFRKINGISGNSKQSAEKEETQSTTSEESSARTRHSDAKPRSLDNSLADESSDETDSNNHRKCNKSLMDDSSLDDMPSPQKYIADDSDVEKQEKAKEVKTVLNPITLAHQQQRIVATAVLEASPAKGSNGDQDDLWGDSDNDNEDDEPEKSKGMSNRSKNARKSKRGKSSSIASSPGRHQAVAADFSDGGSKYWYLRIDDNEIKQLLKNNDEERLKSKLHPELDHPFFGPFELEPFVIGSRTESSHSVPASLSRYLAPYQKEGIQFMHKCLTSNQGTIMGDEMGLGKTVQVIALLCALFEKTGTGLDLLKIKQRNEIIAGEKRVAEIERDKALLEGRFGLQADTGSRDLDLSSWYPVLIIVPPSVVDNWKNEFRNFSNFAVAVYSGDKRFRDMELEKLRDGRAEVLIAAKSMFQSHSSFQPLNAIRWKLVVIDEFHTFKNGTSRLSEHLRELKTNQRSLVLGMTGTLMQNDHKELWNLIDLVETDYLGSWEDFRGDTADAIKYGRQKDADQATIDRSKKKASALNQKLSKLFIERKKDEVLGDLLTNKRQDVVLCPPSDLQKRVFEHIMTLPDVQLVKMANSPCDCGVNQAIYKRYYKLKTAAQRVRYIREHQKQIIPRKQCCYRVPLNPRRNEPGQPVIDPDAVLWRLLDSHDEADETGEGCDRCPYCIMFPILNKLNKLCSHVGSLQAERTPGSSQRGSEEHLQFMKELEFAKVSLPPDVISRIPGGLVRNDTIMDKHFELSGKLKKLDQLLRVFATDGSKVLLFSYSTKTLDFIQNYVRSKGYSHLRIDGSVKAKHRQDLCNEFNGDPNMFLFLLSTKACGLGLNLTSANKVIIFDVEWNPSWDDQAQDRAYRIGQTRDVRVIRLITEGTVDELKYLRQLYKVQLKDETLGSNDNSKAKAARLFRAVQGERHRKGELFGAENLLKFKADGSFLSDVWKSKRSKDRKGHSPGVEIHQAIDLSARLSDDRCIELFDSDPTADMLASFESQTSQHEWVEAKSFSNKKDSSIGVYRESRAAHLTAHGDAGKVLNQEDLMRADRGRAAIEAGEEGYEEEMGGQTQNAYAAFAALADAAINAPDMQGGNERSGSPDIARDGNPGEREEDFSDEAGMQEADEPAVLWNAVNHEDLFDEEEGGAALEEGDAGYDEEMGGGTQNDYAIYETVQLPENPQDAMDEDDAGSAPTVSHRAQADPAVQRIGIPSVELQQQVAGAIERIANNEQRREAEPLHHSRQVSGNSRASKRDGVEAVDEKSSFFSSRHARERPGPRIASGVDASAHKDDKRYHVATVVARPASPNDFTAGCEKIVQATSEPRRKGRSLEKTKPDPGKRPSIALMGKTSSEIAKKGTFDIELPNYKRKKRRK